MRERATAIGAEFEIESEKGVGTEIRVVWEVDGGGDTKGDLKS
jgi:signal transduction histidine kinase